MSVDLSSIENVWQLLKMKLRKQSFTKLSTFDFRNKSGTEIFAMGLVSSTLVHRMNNRISEVIKSDGDFILGC